MISLPSWWTRMVVPSAHKQGVLAEEEQVCGRGENITRRKASAVCGCLGDGRNQVEVFQQVMRHCVSGEKLR